MVRPTANSVFKAALGLSIRDLESNRIRLRPEGYSAFAALEADDKVAAITQTTPPIIAHELVARMPIDNTIAKPVHSAVTTDLTRVYTTLQNQHSIAVFDAMSLQQVDADLKQSGLNTIELGKDARPYWIVIDSEDRYAYVSDWSLDRIYVVDVDPTSETFNTRVGTIHLHAPPSSGSTINFGLPHLALSIDGKRLYATLQRIKDKPGGIQHENGVIWVGDLQELKREIQSRKANSLGPFDSSLNIKIDDIPVGHAPWGIDVTFDPSSGEEVILYSNFKQDFQGSALSM